MKRVILIVLIAGLVVIFANMSYADLNDGLAAYYSFNGNANDESGNGNNGAVYGATLTTDRFGTANSGYSFDGNDYIEVADSNSLDITSKITFSAWINPSDLSTIQMVASKYKDYGEMSYLFELNNSQPRFLIHDVGDVWGNTISTNSWYHIAGTYDGSYMRLYVNGLLDSEVIANGSSSTIPITSQDLNIGRQADNNLWPFMGTMDDVRLYNRALSASEVQQLAITPEPISSVLFLAGGALLAGKRLLRKKRASAIS